MIVLIGNALAVPLYGLFWRAGRVAGSAGPGIPPHWSFAGLLGTLRRAWEVIVESTALMPSPLVTSLLWSSVAALATIVLAWLLAWKSRNAGPWRPVAAACVALPLAAPGPIVGMAFVLAYRDVRLIYDTPAILVLGYIARTLPYALLVLWPVLRTIPPEFLDAAAVDGLGRWGQVRRVALPLSLGAIVAAWFIAFVLALGELPATDRLLPPGLTTISFLVWSLLHTGVESHLAGVGLVLVGLFGLAGLAATWALRRIVRF